MPENRQITLASRPVGLPQESDFALVSTPTPEPGPGEALLQTLYLSVDPYQRGRLRDAPSYAPPVPIGGVIEGATVCRVVHSNNANLANGAVVLARLGWQQYGVTDGTRVRVVDPELAPVSTALGVLGMPGLTAYFGLLEVGQARSGETVLVTAAAGAVGSVVGQIAKIRGCNVVGVAGSDAKVRYITGELGFDAGLNYRTVRGRERGSDATAADYAGALGKLCPDGIDVFFDNVGGPISDAAFTLINVHARVVVCGQIAHYNDVEAATGPRLLYRLIQRRARVQGFLVSDFVEEEQQALAELGRWVRDDRVRYREDVVEGFENTPRAFIGMLEGDNIGKRVVHVAD